MHVDQRVLLTAGDGVLVVEDTMRMPHGTRPPIRNENGDHGTARFVDPFWTWTCLASTTVQPQTCPQDILGMCRGLLMLGAGVDDERIVISLFYAALHRFGLMLTPKRPAVSVD